MQRVTTTGVLRRIERQSSHGARVRDLIALPCSHPDCCSIGYFLRDKNGKLASLTSIVGEESLRHNLSVFGNSIAFSDGLAELPAALANVMSESMTLSRPELLSNLAAICTACDLGGFGQLRALAFRPGATAAFVGERVKRVTIKHFMDADTLIAERLEQCCVHVAGAGNEPVRMPFCAARLFPQVRARAREQWCRARRWRMADVEADESLRRLARRRELEGYAFTFCKAAALALVLRRFTLIGTSLAALICYVLAARAGVREWRCS